MENKEKKFDAYMRPETEEIEIRIENLCGGIESTITCLEDDPCPQDFV